MLEMNFFSAPAMRDLIQRNLDHFCSGVVDPRKAAVIKSDMIGHYCWHSQSNHARAAHFKRFKYSAKPSLASAEKQIPRTWNLLIDVIAQTGRFPQNAASDPEYNKPTCPILWSKVNDASGCIPRSTGLPGE